VVVVVVVVVGEGNKIVADKGSGQSGRVGDCFEENAAAEGGEANALAVDEGDRCTPLFDDSHPSWGHLVEEAGAHDEEVL
jgi:hypothetical protein